MRSTNRWIAAAVFIVVAWPASLTAQDSGPVVIGFDDEDEVAAEEDEKEVESREEVEAEDDAPERRLLPQIEVIGQTLEELASVPGSADVISSEDLERQRPLNAGEALQMMPGVTVQDEEGMGLRQNIGIRGLNPNRSRKVLILENGVPISLAPYGEPEMYYTPPIERMERIELVKGSGSVLFGPQTIGGVINYISPEPPEEFTMEADAQGGTYEYGSGRLSVGDRTENMGYLVSGMHQRFGGPRNLDLVRSDMNVTLTAEPSPTQSLRLNFGVYDEVSASTYLGLTREQFETDSRFNFAENDEFNLRRYAASLTHAAFLGESALLETRFYSHNVSRNWRRQDFDRTDQGLDYERIIDGQGRNITGADNPPEDGSAIYFRDSSGNRNRKFTVAGIEPRLTLDWTLAGVDNELQTGLRAHYEQTEEQRINGEHASSQTGVIANDQERLGYALAAYALNRVMLLDERLTLSPGVRVENLWTNQITYRDRVEDEDGNRVPTDLEPPTENRNYYLAVLPGMGVSFDLAEPVTLFAGVHRGWAPPRTKDGVTTDGDSITLEAEHSWNYEVGARLAAADWISGEVAGFLLDFDNQVVAPNEAGGAVSEGSINGGESTHLGVETAVRVDPAKAAGLDFGLPLMANYTYVYTEFGEGWSGALQGQTLPYAPEHQVAGRVGFEHPFGISLQVDANYISEQFTDKVQTRDASTNGLTGVMDSRFILGAQASYTYEPRDLTVYFAAKNLLNEQYIASRSPRGIQPGLQRHIYGGIRWKY